MQTFLQPHGAFSSPLHVWWLYVVWASIESTLHSIYVHYTIIHVCSAHKVYIWLTLQMHWMRMQGCPRVPPFLSCSQQKLCQGGGTTSHITKHPIHVADDAPRLHCGPASGGSPSHNWFNPHCSDAADDDDTDVLVMSRSLRNWLTAIQLLYAKAKSPWNLRAGLPLYYQYYPGRLQKNHLWNSNMDPRMPFNLLMAQVLNEDIQPKTFLLCTLYIS